MNRKLLNVAIILFSHFLVSCATTMPGKEIPTYYPAVQANIDMDDNFSNKNIQLYQISFKNKSNDWVDIDLGVINEDPKIKVLVGNKINAWIEACVLEKNVSDYNTSLVLGTLAVGGMIVAGSASNSSSSGSTNTMNVAAITSLGAMSGLAVMGFQDSKNRVEFQQKLPEKHAFRAFSIPPKKVIQRWILIENPELKNFQLKFQVNQSKDKIIKLEVDPTKLAIR
jgi:hypothetical protein